MEGNRNLFWKLLEPEHPRAEAFCRRLAGNREDGDDLYQDSLIQALEKFAQLREQSSFRPWLYRIVVNNFNNRIRRPMWKKLVSLTGLNFDGANIDSMPIEPIVSDPEPVYLARLAVDHAFQAVSPSEKALISLFEIEGWSVNDLAALYNCPSGTIKARLSRARTKMRKKLLALSSRVEEDVSVRQLKSARRLSTIARQMTRQENIYGKKTKDKNVKPNASEVDLCVAVKPIND